jgi:hypothetical protein
MLMNIGSTPTICGFPFLEGHRLLPCRLQASGYALSLSPTRQQPILILIVAALASCRSPRMRPAIAKNQTSAKVVLAGLMPELAGNK